MSFLQAVWLGMVEGVTEFLPVSSTGHLILAAKALGIAESDFLKSFEIAIQLGAILSVLALYGNRLFVERGVFLRVLAGFFPTAFLGLIFYPFIKNTLLENTSVVLWSLLLGGVFIIVFEWRYCEKPGVTDRISMMSFKQCFLIGVFQSISIIPGVSRAAATILGGLAAGWKRKTITEFSFLLAVPTMLTATGFDLAKNASEFSKVQFSVLTAGFVVSFVVAIFSVKSLVRFIERHNFMVFGTYRIFLALFFWIFMSY